MEEKKRKFLYALRLLIKMDKKGQIMEELGKVLIYVALLVILLLIVLAFFDKGGMLFEKIKEIFTFGR